MAYTKDDSNLKTSTQKDKKRVQCAATFEVFPQLMGFNEDVILRAVHVDWARNIVRFYFAGDGLEEIEEFEGRTFTHYEGQECCEIVAPAWRDL